MTVAFVLANCRHGAMIVNHFDFNTTWNDQVYGVGAQILHKREYEPKEVDFIRGLLELRRKHFGDGVVMMDCGANIGVHTVEAADLMQGWGSVVAVEAQERIFYALCGNISIHNCFNAKAIWGAIYSEGNAYIEAPEPKYTQAGSFGSFELRDSVGREKIGQDIDYSKPSALIPTFTIDELAGDRRIDLLKIDIEGMEIDALQGAAETLRTRRPIVIIETVKSDKNAITELLGRYGYEIKPFGMNVIAVHHSDPVKANIQVTYHKQAAA